MASKPLGNASPSLVANDGERLDDVGDNDDDGESVIPDSIEAECSPAEENNRDCVDTDGFEGKICIRCNEDGVKVLVCSGDDCPVLLHEACMNFKPKFDDMGNFYCPYCWYRRELSRTRELKREVMLAKMHLSNFIGSKMATGTEEKGECTSMEDGGNECHNKLEKVEEDQEQNKTSSTFSKKDDILTDKTCETAGVLEDNHGGIRKEEQLNPPRVKNSILPIKITRPVKTASMWPMLGNEKRRRLHWTAEEEEMLKEGVQRFSSMSNKYLPWKKILEFGQHVFHETRTPVDLKDKWKNIMAKESPPSKRRLP